MGMAGLDRKRESKARKLRECFFQVVLRIDIFFGSDNSTNDALQLCSPRY